MRSADRPDGAATADSTASGLKPGSVRADPSRLKQVLRRIRTAVTVLLFGVALLLALLRFGLPVLADHPQRVQQWISEILERPVTIHSLRAYWRGWSPELEIRDLRLYAAGESAGQADPVLVLERARISLDPLASLKSGDIQAHSVTLQGASLTVRRMQDGSVMVAGMRPGAGIPPGRATENLARWMLGEGYLSFESATVNWVDERRGGDPLLLANVRLDLRNSGARHRLSGSFRYPGLSTERVDFALQVRGDMTTSDWFGRMMLSGMNIQADQLARLFEPLRPWVADGRADVSVWTDWKRGALEAMRTQVRANGLMLGSALGGLRVHGGTAAIRTARLNNGWSADVVLEGLHTSEGRWRTTRGTLNYVLGAGNGSPRLIGRFDHARLADLISAMGNRMPQIDFAGRSLRNFQPSADLHDLSFALGLESTPLDSLELTADFSDLSAFAGAGFPGISGYSGRLEVNGDAGVLRLDGGTLDVALPGVFGGRFLIDTEGGRLAWRKDSAGLRVDVYGVEFRAPALDGQFSAFGHWDNGNTAPLVNVVARVNSDDASAVHRYLPDRLLSDKLLKWLRQSIKGGRITDGRLLLHGRLDEFPFDAGEGNFEARFDVAGGELAYAPGWPAFTDLSGTVRIKGRSIRAEVDGGTVFSSSVQQAFVAIDDIGRRIPVVEIEGEAAGKAGDGLRFLLESPLDLPYSAHLRNLAVGGDARLRMSLDVPLDKSGIRIDGRVGLEGNSIDLPRLATGLRDVTGTLRFDRRGVEGERVDATYLGRPLTLSLKTAVAESPKTRIHIEGRADARFVAAHMENTGVMDAVAKPAGGWLDSFEGESAWRATVDVPARTDGQAPKYRLEFFSNLHGLAVDLPEPFGKSAESFREMTVSVDLVSETTRNVWARYGDVARAALAMERAGEATRIRRGEVQVGPGDARVPETDGLRIRGNLNRVAADEWLDLWRRAPADARENVNLLDSLRDISLGIDRLVLLGSEFDHTRLTIRPLPDGAWNARFDGEGIAGVIRTPAGPAGGRLVAEFEEIRYRSVAGREDAPSLDPRNIPPLRFTAGRFVYDGQDLGRIELTASPHHDGLRFESIEVDSAHFDATATGHWSRNEAGHHSGFLIRVHSRDLGRFLESLGFGATNVSGGNTDIVVDARWDAAPMDFELSRVDGMLHIRSTDGRLLGISPGAAGRIFGLLSVSALPRRLTLDFADLFEQGVGYQLMEGSFTLGNGQAYTNDLRLETTTARVEIAGRTGLVAEDYDQVVTVTPKLNASLPFAPIWLAEKLFQRPFLNKVFSYQYTISGPWSDPEVKPVPAPETKAADRG